MQATVDEQTSAAGSQALVDLAAGIPADQQHDIANIHRIVGDFTFGLVSVNAQAFGRFGIISMSGDAFAAGAVPELIGDFEAPWWYNDAFFKDGEVSLTERLKIDFKLNRRFNANTALAFILDLASGSNGSLLWSLHLRVLYSHK